MKPTQHRQTNKQKSYDDLFWAIRKCLIKLKCGEWYSLIKHYILKDISKPFPVGLRCEGFWWPTCKVCFQRNLFPRANYLQRIQHKHALCTITCHTHNSYFCILSLLTLVGYFCRWDGTEGQCALGIYIHFSIQYTDIIHLVLVTKTSRMLAVWSRYVKGIVHPKMKIQGV